MLDELTSLARERCPENRKQLLSAVADLFVQTETVRSEVSVSLFQDVVSQLLDEVDTDGRATFSRTVASCEQTPPELAERLAREDDVSVAGPILRASPVLSDAILADIASSKSQAHLHEISRRDQLAAAVTDVIVDRGDRDVVRAVASNAGASFSERGFGRLARRAMIDDTLVEHLFGRTDIPKAVAGQLLDGMSDTVRLRLVHLAGQNVAVASNLVRKAAARFQPNDKPAAQENTLNARGIAIAIAAGDTSIDEAVSQLAAHKRLGDLAFVLGKLADVPAPNMRAALSKTDLTGAAVVCKKLNVSLVAFRRLASFIGDELSLPESHVDHFVGKYETLEAATAERVSRFVAARRSAINAADTDRQAP